MQHETWSIDLPYDLGDGLSAELRDESTVDEMLDLTERNLDRLREWEHWAHGEQTREGLASFTTYMLGEHAAKRAIPVVLRENGVAVGAASSRRSGVVVEIGYWVDAAMEGRGAATRVSQAFIDVWREEGVRRFLIRTAVDNGAARRVAEKLGFDLDEVRRGGFPVGTRLRDAAMYRLDL